MSEDRTMTTITDAERGKALSEVIRSLSYLDPEGRGDNLAILLCCVFDEHPDCPSDEHEGDYGWKPWVEERADAALLMLAEGALDALLSLGWRPAGNMTHASEWTDEDGRDVQNGAGTKAPLYVYANADYEAGDGSVGLHETVKRANEPAIQYVRADISTISQRPAPVVDDAMVERAEKAWLHSTRNFGPLSLDGWGWKMRGTIRDAITAATRAALIAALAPET